MNSASQLPTPGKTQGQVRSALTLAFVGAFCAYLYFQTVHAKPFLTMTSKVPWVWEMTGFGYFYKVAQDNKEQVKDFYWAKSVVMTAIAAFGGGFLAPLIVCHNPVPLMEETFLWMVVGAWYIVHNAPMINAPLEALYQSVPGRALFVVLFAIFKTNQITGGIELADTAIIAENLVNHSRYFNIPMAAPLICGFLSGCGGAFLPFEKGLRPIAEGKQWPVRSSFFATVFYYFATRYFGWAKLDAKLCCCLFRAWGDMFPSARDTCLNPATQLLNESILGKLPEEKK